MSKAIGISIFALILMALSATPVYSQIPTRSPSASAVGISVESDSIAEETSQESTQSGEKEEIKKLKKEDPKLGLIITVDHGITVGGGEKK